jgi:GDP-mannose 6-dehydrogenase
MDITVYDPDVCLDEMLGSNREYLERQLPYIHRILWQSLRQALDGCQAVIVSQKRPEFIAAVQDLPGHVAVLDLVRLQQSRHLRKNYKGIAW